jgi:AcrR family transcriptional regulator
MKTAQSEGVPVARIAREAGVSRPTVYEWLTRR